MKFNDSSIICANHKNELQEVLNGLFYNKPTLYFDGSIGVYTSISGLVE